MENSEKGKKGLKKQASIKKTKNKTNKKGKMLCREKN